MAKASIRARLLGDPDLIASGLWIHGGPRNVEMAGLCGYDFVIVDMQHTALNEEGVEEYARAGEARGISVLVRVEGPRSRSIGRVLDTGVEGVLIPMVESAEEVQDAVEAALVAPEGRRSWATTTRAAGYNVADYATGATSSAYGPNRSTGPRERPFVGVLIETKRAVENFDRILAVPHLDAVLPTTGDLSRQLRSNGMSDDEAEKLLDAAWSKILERYPRSEGPFFCVPAHRRGWNLDECRHRGVRLVTHPMDTQLLAVALERVLTDWRAGKRPNHWLGL